MEDITIELIKAFIASGNIAFVATQPKLLVPIICMMCRKISYGIRFDEIKVCNNLIIDGHHRYLSVMMMNYELGRVMSNYTSATEEIAWNLLGIQ